MGHLRDLKNNAYKHVHHVKPGDIDPEDEWEIVSTSTVNELSFIERMKAKYKLTIRQQLQVLHYIGELAQYDGQSKKKKSEALARVLGKKSSQSIREIFTDYPDVVKSNRKAEAGKIKADLNYLLTVFSQEDRKDIVSKISSDISELG